MLRRRLTTAAVLLAAAAAPSPALADTPWSAGAAVRRPTAGVAERGHRFALDASALRRRLARAPAEGARVTAVPTTVSIPDPSGGLQRFTAVSSPVVAPELARALPEVRTYSGRGIDDPAATVRFDITPLGFHASVRSPSGSWYVDPGVTAGQVVAYRAADALAPDELGERQPPLDLAAPVLAPPGRRSAGGDVVVRRTYRLALVADPRFTSRFGGAAGAEAQKISLVNRVNQVYNDDLAIRLELVAGDQDLNFTSKDAFVAAGFPSAYDDPFSGGCTSAALAANQRYVDARIGAAAYDVGHLALGVAGGGLAGLGVVGRDGQKARGCTGLDAPTGDYYAVDYLAHELGHEFGGNHTFNGSLGSCAGGNRNAATAVEPGSGSSIMAYAGICNAAGSSDDLQRNSDPYFSQRSIAEIRAYVDGTVLGDPDATNGGTAQTTGNRSPVVASADDVTIPPRTPFTLTGSATDADGDLPVFSWEQDDAGATATRLTANTKPAGPLFRQFGLRAQEADPTLIGPDGENQATAADASRTFPDAAQVAAGNTNAASGQCTATTPPTAAQVDCFSEFLPTTARTMRFRLTARDLCTTGGGVSSALTVVTVAGTAPFRVTAPATPATVDPGAAVTVTWDVAGTAAAPVGADQVAIGWSTDGGLTFPVTLAAATPNDGTERVTIPAGATAQGRFRVAAVGNVFFDVSHADLTVTGAPPAAPPASPEAATPASRCPAAGPSGTVSPAGSSTAPADTGTPAPATTTEASRPAATASPEPPAAAPTGGVLGDTAAGPATRGRLRPVLSGIARRLAVRRGAVAVPVRCGRLGTETPPARCAGTATLRARVGGRTRTVATARFDVRRGARAVVRLRLGAAARRALIRRDLRATVRVAVRNPGAAAGRGSRVVRLTAGRR